MSKNFSRGFSYKSHLERGAPLFTCGVGVAANDVVYLSAASTVAKAKADSASTMPAMGVVAFKPTTTTCVVFPYGQVSGFGGLTIGGIVYVSPTTAGAVTQTAPSSPNVKQTVGVAVSATDILFNFGAPIMDQITGTGTTQFYLTDPVFGNATGTVSGNVEIASYAGDFESLTKMSSTSASAALHATYQGRLGAGQTIVKSVHIGFKRSGGTPNYRLRIYAEGSGASPVYDSTLLAAPVGLTYTTVLDTDLSAQPTGNGKFFIDVRAEMNAAEAVLNTYPFVRQQ